MALPTSRPKGYDILTDNYGEFTGELWGNDGKKITDFNLRINFFAGTDNTLSGLIKSFPQITDTPLIVPVDENDDIIHSSSSVYWEDTFKNLTKVRSNLFPIVWRSTTTDIELWINYKTSPYGVRMVEGCGIGTSFLGADRAYAKLAYRMLVAYGQFDIPIAKTSTSSTYTDMRAIRISTSGSITYISSNKTLYKYLVPKLYARMTEIDNTKNFSIIREYTLDIEGNKVPLYMWDSPFYYTGSGSGWGIDTQYDIITSDAFTPDSVGYVPHGSRSYVVVKNINPNFINLPSVYSERYFLSKYGFTNINLPKVNSYTTFTIKDGSTENTDTVDYFIEKYKWLETDDHGTIEWSTSPHSCIGHYFNGTEIVEGSVFKLASSLFGALGYAENTSNQFRSVACIFSYQDEETNEVYPRGTLFITPTTSYMELFSTTGGANQRWYDNILSNWGYKAYAPEPTPEEDDPYKKQPTSGTGGGNGSYNSNSDNINTDYINTGIGSLDNIGLQTIFVPTPAELKALADKLYSDNIGGVLSNIWTTVGTLGQDPFEYLIDLHMVPVNVPSYGPVPLQMGIFKDLSTSMHYTTNRYVDVDLGTLHVEPYWGNDLDYKTSVQIWLPYVGYQGLDTVDVIDKDIKVEYRIDLTSGDCVAQIWIDNSIKYQFNGNCAYSIPLGKSGFTDMIQKSQQVAMGVVSGTAMMNAGSALSSAGTRDWMIGTGSNGGTRKGYRDQVSGAKKDIAEGNKMYTKGSTEVGDSLQSALSNIGGSTLRGGSLGGQTGFISIQRPYLIISRPNLSYPENYGRYNGFPSNITSRLGDLTGYTEVGAIHIEGIPCTLDEMGEIENLLHGGVII